MSLLVFRAVLPPVLVSASGVAVVLDDPPCAAFKGGSLLLTGVSALPAPSRRLH